MRSTLILTISASCPKFTHTNTPFLPFTHTNTPCPPPFLPSHMLTPCLESFHSSLNTHQHTLPTTHPSLYAHQHTLPSTLPFTHTNTPSPPPFPSFTYPALYPSIPSNTPTHPALHPSLPSHTQPSTLPSLHTCQHTLLSPFLLQIPFHKHPTLLTLNTYIPSHHLSFL